MTELRGFKERHGASRVVIAFAALVGAASGVAITTTVTVNGGVSQALERMVSGHSENGLALLNDSDGPKFDGGHASALAETEKNAIDKKAAMLDASDALRRMAAASDMTSDAYPSGEAGLEARQRDFVAAPRLSSTREAKPTFSRTATQAPVRAGRRTNSRSRWMPWMPSARLAR